MGQYETKSSGKRFRKGTPIKYVHPLFKKNTTLEVLQSIRRRTRSNNEEQKLIKQIEKSKNLALQQRIQLIRYQNIARALEDEIHIREEALLKQQQVEQEHRRKHGQKHGQKHGIKHGIKHGQNTGQKQKPVKQKAKEKMYEQKQTKKRKRSNPSVSHSSVLHSSMLNSSVLNSAVLNLSGFQSSFQASASHSSPIMTTSSESNSVGTSNNNCSNEFSFMVDGLDSSNLHSAPVAVTTSESVVFPPKPNDEFKFMLDDVDFNFSNNDLLNLDIDTNRVEEHYWNEINVMSSS